MRIEHRKQREADSGRAGGGDDAPRKFGRVGKGLAFGIVMHVMEFCDRRVSRFRHFDIDLRGDRLESVGVDAIQERVHRLPPRPEAVVVRQRRPAGAAGERALESMGVHVRHRGNDWTRGPFRPGRIGIRLDAGDHPVVTDDEHHIARPTRGQQRRVCGEPQQESLT